MRTTNLRVLIATLLTGGLAAASVSAQSLADVARREQAREKTIKVHGRAYTNADLQHSRTDDSEAAVSPEKATPASPDAAEKTGEQPIDATASTKPADKASADEGENAKSPAHDREYWQKRMATARATRDQAQLLLDAMQSRINALAADFAARDDPQQRAQIGQQRDKALVALDALKKALGEATRGIADLEEEARRAGVPPGWLRD